MLQKIEKLFRRYVPKRMKGYKAYITALRNKSGIEIGGPSPTFTSKGFLPLYDVIKSLDGCNFSTNTLWEGNITEGNTYQFGKRKGRQIISEGSSLEKIPDGSYDFLLSCHSLEHIANPIKALMEWKRIIKDEGHIVLILPHKDNTFDRDRPLTALEHLIDDYKKQTQENDDTHFAEILQLHDISRDPGIVNIEELKNRTADNFTNRGAHHHVFNTPLVVNLVNYLRFKILNIQHFNPFNIIVLLQKNTGKIPDNSGFLDPGNKIYQKPSFPSDKLW